MSFCSTKKLRRKSNLHLHPRILLVKSVAMNLPTSACIEIINKASRSIVESHYIALCVVNSVLSVPTIAANALVIMAILTTSTLQTPSYLLLTSLAFTDLAVGLVGQPVFVATIKIFMEGDAQSYCYIRTVSALVLILFILISILTVTAISVDRYLAIRLKMRYRSVVTIRRIRFVVIFLWGFSVLNVGALPFNISISLLVLLGGIALVICLFIILFCYSMSFRSLKAYCAQVQSLGNQQQNSTAPAINILKYKKLLKTMLLILVLIFSCYLPLTGIFAIFSDPTPDRALAWALQSIVSLNSALNPFLYMIRMRDIRHASIRVVGRLFRCQ